MEVEQTMARLLAEIITREIKANQEKTDANLKEIRAGQEHLRRNESWPRTPERRNAGRD
jgi:hypothetical protein